MFIENNHKKKTMLHLQRDNQRNCDTLKTTKTSIKKSGQLRLGGGHFPWYSIATEILYYTYEGRTSKVWIIKETSTVIMEREREKKKTWLTYFWHV